MSNSPMVVYTKISPHRSSRGGRKIEKITIHHMAGFGTIEQCAAEFQKDRKASSNYGIGSDGRVGMYVEEKDAACTSSSYDNDSRAVTIEVANISGDPDWKVSNAALAALIDLCEDICRRNGIPRLNFTGDKSGNLTMHKWFAPTACPGPYLESKFPYIAEEVNDRLAAAEPTEPQQPDPEVPEDPAAPDDSETPGTSVAPEGTEAPEDSEAPEDTKAPENPGTRYCVRVGTFANRDNAQRLLAQLSAAGFHGFIDTLNAAEPTKPQPEQPANKSVEEVAREVVWGLWGVGSDRRQRLTEAGYDYAAVQTAVDKVMGR